MESNETASESSLSFNQGAAFKNDGYFLLEELVWLKENLFPAWIFNSLACSNHILG